MNRTITMTLIGLLVATSLSGCIENMQDLKDRMGAAETEAETVEQQTVSDALLTNETNETAEPTEPPVARITIYGAKGALVFKSSFIAEDVADPIYTTAPATLKLIATDSQAFEPGAELTTYTWNFAGMTMEGAQAEHALEGPGTYNITLSVGDSKGGTDTQNLTLVVTPNPFDVVTELTTTPIIGAEQQGQTGTTTYELTTDLGDEKTYTVQQLTIHADSTDTCLDIILEIVTPAGETITVDGAFIGDESATIPEPPTGAYTINIIPYTCVAPTGIDITVTATYIEIVEGVPEHDGHAH